MSWGTWTIAATLLSMGLAGCVKPMPDELECSDDCGSCYTFTVADCCTTCCHGCGAPPPSPAPIPYDPPACPSYNATFGGSVEQLSCAYPVPPVLAPLVAQRLLELCDGCRHAALASDGLRAFVATEQALLVGSASGVRTVPMPAPLERPHVAMGADGLLWLVGLDRSGAAPRVLLASYAGGDSFAETAYLDALAAPVVLLAQRAFVAPALDAVVVLLDADHAAWSVAYTGSFGSVERVTPLGGEALVGAPVVDLRGRVLLPYAFTARDALQDAAGLLVPAVRSTSLHHAALVDGAWTQHGGAVLPQGASSPPALELARSGVAAWSWVDGSGALQRMETWHDGSHGSPTLWSDPAAAVRGAPAAQRSEHFATAAWWEEDREGARLVVARTDGGSMPVTRQRTGTGDGGSDAALALLGDGRALVAWVDNGGAVWLAIEGGAFPPEPDRCGDGSHCGRHSLRW